MGNNEVDLHLRNEIFFEKNIMDWLKKLGSELETLDKIPPKSSNFGGISIEKVTIFEAAFSLTTCLPTDGSNPRHAEKDVLSPFINVVPPVSAGGFGLFFDLRRRFWMDFPATQGDGEGCPLHRVLYKWPST